MKLAIKTFGCRANSADTDILYMEAKRRGFELVGENDVADAYIINSCTVTSHADRDARSQVRKFKRLNPNSLVGVIGCYGQVSKEELIANPAIDYVLGTAEKNAILDLFTKSLTPKDQVANTTGFLVEDFPGSRYSRATVKIQDGCNFKCTFCIIPQARGKSRSLPLNTALKQIEQAYEQGYEEVVLSGIHLAHYGWDQNTDLVELLERTLSLPKGPRIRLTSLDPFEIPSRLIEMTSHPRLCPHFHIALQSGNDKVLKSMKRFYKAQEFVHVTENIYNKSPDTFIGVDIIVGFPEEGEEEFNDTLQCLKDSFWTKLHVFSFSARRDTPAVHMTQVAAAEITNRSKILRNLSEERYERFLISQIGKKKDVLLERPSKKHPGLWLGHTENYLPTFSKTSGKQKHIIPSIIKKRMGERVLTEQAT